MSKKTRVEELEKQVAQLKLELAERVDRHDRDGKALIQATKELDRYKEFHDLAKEAINEANSTRIRCSPSLYKILGEVSAERQRQDAKWGEQNHKDGTGGEDARGRAHLAKEACESALRQGRATWAHILIEEVMEAMAETDQEKLITELTQVAAVACAWVEAIRRRTE